MAVTNNLVELNLTGAQLCLAGQIVGYGQLLLPGDPFQGWLVEEIAEAFEQARQELVQTDLLIDSGKGEIPLSPDLAQVVVAVGAPKRSCLLTSINPHEQPSEFFCYQADSGWVSIEKQNTETYSVKFIPDNGSLIGFFKHHCGVSDQAAAHGDDFSLPGATLEQARRKAGSGGLQSCVDYLLKAGLPDNPAELLAKTLVNPSTSGSLISLCWQGKKSNQSCMLAFLAGEAGMWEMRPDRDVPDFVTLFPISGKDVNKKIELLVQTLCDI